MNFYDTVIDLYLEKKTIKQYQTLEEFDDDLKQFNLDFSFDLIEDNYNLYTKLNEVDYTFLICKIIDEKEYLIAYQIVDRNVKFLNQIIIDKFKANLNDPKMDLKLRDSDPTLKKLIERVVINHEPNKQINIPIDFLSIIYASKDNASPNFKLDEYVSKLSEIIDFTDLYYIDNSYPLDMKYYDYIHQMKQMSIYNQNYIFKTFIDKNIMDPGIKTLEEFYNRYPVSS